MHREALGPACCARQIQNSGAGKSICHKGRGVNAARRNHPPIPPNALPGAYFGTPSRPGKRSESTGRPRWNSQRNIGPLRSLYLQHLWRQKSAATPREPGAGAATRNLGLSDLGFKGKSTKYTVLSVASKYFFSLEQAVKSRIKRGH